MKKVLGVIIAIVCVIIIGTQLVFNMIKDDTDTPVIGGSDGPTSIFLIGD